MQKPLVSVWMITYNHEKFIAQALDSALMQKTIFDFEIVIGEDCSTDGTRSIIEDFVNKYPEKIHAIYQEKNVGFLRNAYEFTLPQCKGKYIACLEGDDYWTDPDKLQKQIDFLEANPDFAICFHNVQIIFEGVPDENWLMKFSQKQVSDIYDLAKVNFIRTPSCVFRKPNYEIPDWFYTLQVTDYPLHLLNAQYGKIRYIDETMGVYRVHKGGIWQTKPYAHRLLIWINLLNMLIGKFEPKVNEILLEQQMKLLSDLKNVESELTFNGLPKCLHDLVDEHIKLKRLMSENEKELRYFKNSKSYKIGNFILKPLILLMKLKK